MNNESKGNKSSIYEFFRKLTSSDDSDREFKKCIVKYFISSVIFIIVCIILLSIITNPGRANYHIQKYFFVYMFPLLMIFAIILNLSNNANNRRPFLEIFGIFIILGIAIYYYTLSSGESIDLSGISNTLIIIAICLVALTLIYNALIGYLSRLRGWPGFIAQLIFYLPCVLYEAWIYLLDQFKLTSFAVYGLILLEILFIIIYIYFPTISQKVAGTDNSILLQKNVLPLNRGKKVIGTSSMLKQKPTIEMEKMGLTNSYYPRNYAISFWVYVNPQTPANYSYSRESQILNYSYLDKHGHYRVKPLITYYGGGNTTDLPQERNKFVFYFVEYKDLQLINDVESYLTTIRKEISVTQNKINELNQSINDPNLDDTEKEKIKQEIIDLKIYETKLTNTKQIKTVKEQIKQYEQDITNSQLSTQQIQDLQKTLDSTNSKLTLLTQDENFSEDEILMLNTGSYDTMKDTFYSLTLPSQKWNQIVVNYLDNKVDIFINGELERTFHLAGKDIPTAGMEKSEGLETLLPTYNDLDTITVGDDFGIDGGICNVEYYKLPLTAEQISFTYNTMVISDPPIPRQEEEKK
jgi:hypothetical protein